jgi:peptide/nickel transport system permease protein
MGRYLLRRLGFAIALVLVVSSSALVLTRLAPGDFVETQQGLDLDAEARARMRASLGLDRPLAAQYLSWLGGVVRFDFGRSLLYARPVGELLRERAANTAVLATAALLFATVVGIPLGIYSGSRRRGVGRAIVRMLSLLCLSVPPLIGSLGLVFLAARTGWFPVGGMSSSTGVDLSLAERLADMARHLPLPMLALGIPLAASLERLQSQAIASAVRERFVAASRARGLAGARAVLRHAWPVSIGPVLGIYGVMIGSVFSGSFAVEVVTSWPGLGRLMFDALKARDLFLVAGCAATGALFLAAGTLLADLLHASTDPRVASGERA